MRILVTRPIPEVGVNVLRQVGHEVIVSPRDRAMPAAELLAATVGIDGLLSMLTDRIDAAFLDARPNVRAVSNFAVGYNNIDVPACTARKIGVANTPDVLTDATAESAWMLLMMAARRAGEAERVLRAKRWDGWGPLQFLGIGIVGKTLGIIGAGRIGSRFARMASGFGMRLLYHNRRASAEMEAMGARLVLLDDLLRESDFVSIHVPLVPETRHFISRRELALMKPTAVLVNTARGPVVDEAALVEALREKCIFAAGLDVYEREPVVEEGLFALENVVLLPHIGSATVGTREAMAELSARNLVAMLSGRSPASPVNPEIWS
ncbi:MAG TPA: D-glycerate dehydrogenase [Phycisphaerae bacterium]|nr:D-glycerate dehydrogenase [Phycisphaerae bacterium]